MFRRIIPSISVAAVALLVAACGSPAESGGQGADEETAPKIAFFGYAAANSWAQATFDGIEEAAKEHGGTAKFLDGAFDASAQVAQLQDAVVSGQYNIFVVQANSGEAVASQVEKAIKAGIVVVAVDTPIGSDFNAIDPQIEGLISVVIPSRGGGEAMGELGVQACKGIDPCQVAYMSGDPTLPFNVERDEGALETLKASPNVEVVATPVGGFTQDIGRAVAQDMLVAQPDLDVLIGQSQPIDGARQVLEELGKEGKVALVGMGGSTQAVDGIRAGTWFGTVISSLTSVGNTAATYGIEKLNGENPPAGTNALSVGPMGKHMGLGTAETLGDYEAQYSD